MSFISDSLISGLVLVSLVITPVGAVSLYAQTTEPRVATPSLVPQPYFTEPALSPDRSEIVFVSGGDIWTVPASGGVAALLVSHPSNEARPFYSPSGKEIAFISNRTGNGDVYVVTLATGDLRRIRSRLLFVEKYSPLHRLTAVMPLVFRSAEPMNIR